MYSIETLRSPLVYGVFFIEGLEMSFFTDKIEMFNRRRIVISRYCVKCGKKTVKAFMAPDNYAT